MAGLRDRIGRLEASEQQAARREVRRILAGLSDQEIAVLVCPFMRAEDEGQPFPYKPRYTPEEAAAHEAVEDRGLTEELWDAALGLDWHELSHEERQGRCDQLFRPVYARREGIMAHVGKLEAEHERRK